MDRGVQVHQLCVLDAAGMPVLQQPIKLDVAGLALLADDYLRIAGNNAVDNGRRTFEFRAMKPGNYQVLFEKRMGWKYTAEDRRVYRVTVSSNSSSSGSA